MPEIFCDSVKIELLNALLEKVIIRHLQVML